LTSRKTISAEVLTRIMLMQNMVSKLPGQDSIFQFIKKGIQDIPGVQSVLYTVSPGECEEKSFPENQECVTICSNNTVYGAFIITAEDLDSYRLYSPYIQNLLSMVSMVLGERTQREIIRRHQEELEQLVEERTAELRNEINQRALAEKELFSEKERLSVTLHSIGDAVITTDTEGRVIMMNKAAEALTGWVYTDAAGKPLAEVFKLFDETTGNQLDTPVDEVIRTGEIVLMSNHTKLVSRAGTEYIISDSAAPIHDSDKKLVGVILVFRDETEKRRTTEVLQRSDKLESLGILAGGIAHDFNNLLFGIFGYLNLARETIGENHEAHEFLANALDSFNRARDLTRQLLTFSKGGAPVFETLLLNNLVRKSCRFALSGTSVKCRFSLQDDLWNCRVDPNQFGQVISNLAINAAQAMDSFGELSITSTNLELKDGSHPVLERGRYVTLSLRDNGPGMDKNIQRQVFDPFFSTKETGTGLGLTTCYSIMNRHNGYIELKSQPGLGTTFVLYFPAVEQDSVEDEVKTDHAVTGNGTILIMDDEPLNRKLLAIFLGRNGYSCLEAERGSEALKQLREKGSEITGVFLDLTVPGGKGGKEIIEELRKEYPDLPVIAFSGYSEDPVMSNPGEHGFTASLPKPFDQSELLAILQNYFM
jgi:PAS domain S-box-containing protein